MAEGAVEIGLHCFSYFFPLKLPVTGLLSNSKAVIKPNKAEVSTVMPTGRRGEGFGSC